MILAAGTPPVRSRARHVLAPVAIIRESRKRAAGSPVARAPLPPPPVAPACPSLLRDTRFLGKCRYAARSGQRSSYPSRSSRTADLAHPETPRPFPSEQVRGPVIQPGDAGYDEARAVYNAMIDQQQAAIARCADVADVMTAVQFARRQRAEVSVRGGGHNRPAWACGTTRWSSTCPLMRGVTVNPAAQTVRAEGGCVWGDVDHATAAFGLATPSGILSCTGVAGLTLGGGIGNLARRYGLTVDNLLAADVVLADGSFVTASEDSYPDLFWALRGGGGNFGVVTSFLFRCHDIGEAGTIIAGPVLYDLADTGEVMRWYREMQPILPEELSGWLALLTIPPAPPFPEALWLRKAVGIVWCYTGGRARPMRCSPRSGHSARRCWTGSSRCRSPCCRARSTRCSRPGCSGTGGPTSSTRSPTRRSPCTRSSARRCPPPLHHASVSHRRGGQPGAVRTPPRSPTGTPAGPGSSSASIRIRPTRARSRNGPGILGRAAPNLGGGAYVNFMMDEGRRPGARLVRPELRPAGPDQGTLRPGQLLPHQPEHPARQRIGRVGRAHL